MTKVKICGLIDLENAYYVATAGADMLGLNFYYQSPRFVGIEKATEICDVLRDELGEACPVFVGIFVNATVDDISSVTSKVGLDFAQLSGDETDDMLVELRGIAFKSIRPMNKAMALDDVEYFSQHMPADERAPSLLLDAYHPRLYGGTGDSASTEVALAVKEQVPRLMLAGGLNPENVGARVKAIRPWGVDVASGVESEPGIKDIDLVTAFIEAAKGT